MAWFFAHDGAARTWLGIYRAEKMWGIKAYAAYFKVLEVMCTAEHTQHRLTWDDIEGLGEEWGLPELRAMVEHFLSPSSGLMQTNGSEVWSHVVTDSMERKEQKSRSAKKAAETRWKRARSNTLVEELCNAPAVQPRIAKEEGMDGMNSKKKEEIADHSIPFQRPVLSESDLGLNLLPGKKRNREGVL